MFNQIYQVAMQLQHSRLELDITALQIFKLSAEQISVVHFPMNLGYHSINQKFNVAFNGAYTVGQSKMISLPGAITLVPSAFLLYDSSGNFNYSGWGPQNSVTRSVFPFANLKQPYSSKSNFLNGNIVLAYQPVKGLKLSTSLGYNRAASGK